MPFRKSLRDLKGPALNVSKGPALSLSKGFTLVELLVVIAIIAVLSTLLLLQLGVARAKARDAKRIADINQLRSAAELYFDDNSGQYPLALSVTTIGGYLSAPAVPLDPVTGAGYFYAFDPLVPPVIRYHLWTELEKKSNGLTGDSDIDSSAWGGGGASRYNATAATTEVCTAAYAAGVARDCIYDTGQK